MILSLQVKKAVPAMDFVQLLVQLALMWVIISIFA